MQFFVLCAQLMFLQKNIPFMHEALLFKLFHSEVKREIMSHQERIFVVVNPTLDKQVALDRALITSKLMTPSPEICVFVAVDSNTVNLDARNPSIYRDTDWFEQ